MSLLTAATKYSIYATRIVPYKYQYLKFPVLQDGILTAALRKCSVSTRAGNQWLVLDGPVDALWVDALNTVLDDNRMLCLPNSEKIHLPPSVSIVCKVVQLNVDVPVQTNITSCWRLQAVVSHLQRRTLPT